MIFTKFNFYVIIISFILIVFSEAIFSKILNKKKNLAITFLSTSVKVFIFLSGSFIIASQYKQFDSFLNALTSNIALMAAILGFAFQQVIKNVLSGMMLVSSEVFKIGDRIRLPEKGITGVIEELTIRHTTLKLATNERAIIPNSIMNEAIVINNNIKDVITSYPIVFPLKNTVDVDKAINLIKEEINLSDNILNKEETVPLISHLTSGEFQIKMLIWTKDLNTSFKEVSDLKFRIIKRFQEEKIY